MRLLSLPELLPQSGLRYNENGSREGAQTERPGVAGPVRALLAGLASPATFHDAALHRASCRRLSLAVRRHRSRTAPIPGVPLLAAERLPDRAPSRSRYPAASAAEISPP